MPEMIEVIDRPGAGRRPFTMICKKCKKEKSPDNFLTNKGWNENHEKDAWCKECATRLKNKEAAREYFW